MRYLSCRTCELARARVPALCDEIGERAAAHIRHDDPERLLPHERVDVPAQYYSITAVRMHASTPVHMNAALSLALSLALSISHITSVFVPLHACMRARVCTCHTRVHVCACVRACARLLSSDCTALRIPPAHSPTPARPPAGRPTRAAEPSCAYAKPTELLCRAFKPQNKTKPQVTPDFCESIRIAYSSTRTHT